MHQLWSYSGDKRIKQDVIQVKLLCEKIQQEPSFNRRRAWRSEIEQYCYRLGQEQRIISRALDSMERDWERYMDTESRDQYYAELTQLYLLAGGHWAARQEGGTVHELTHRPNIPTTDSDWGWTRDTALPVQHSRGRAKLFKS